MKAKRWSWPLAVSAMAALVGMQSAQAAGYERLTKYVNTVLKTCNPNDSASNGTCRVTSLPGESGFTLVASRSAPLIRNDTNVGTVYEKVWRQSSDSSKNIYGVRMVLNKEASDSTGLALNVNDVFRRTLPKKRVWVAYYQDTATKAVRRAGRTLQGLNEYEGSQPARDNTWVRFSVDVNAAETSGPSSAASPWLLTKTRANKGYAVNPLGLRLLSTDFADIDQDAFDLYTASYQPNGVPPPTDDEEDGDDPD